MKNDFKIMLKETRQGDKFVGFRLMDKIPTIYFPHGFDFSRYNTPKEPTKEDRKDIILLMKILKKYLNNNDGLISQNNKEKKCFPFFTAYELLENFIENGYYIDLESQYIKAKHGKIIWKKTIKQCNPYFCKNNVIYNEFITQKNIVNIDSIIRKIHKKCIYDAYSKIGPILGEMDLEDEYINIDKHRDYYINILISEKNNTFNENKRKVLSLLIEYILNVNLENDGEQVEYGTYEFHTIWEKLIDTVLECKNKIEYYPKGVINIMNSGEKIIPPLREDSIYFTKKYCIIVDSKYYKYGLSQNPIQSLSNNDQYNLPGFSDINKQITYAEYVRHTYHQKVKKDFKVTDHNIFNFFVLPYSEKMVSNELKSDENLLLEKIKIRYIGYAKQEWSNAHKSYNFIHILLVDTKLLMQNYMNITTKDLNNAIDAIVEKIINKKREK